MAADPNSRISL
nr:unnamed protein product [Callosobruchus analis]CAI5851452.1 unnamed protein product [Callosobruchus analis]CAI5851457.1 unnamed protein product [Callosobruchus analis]